jgi:5-methylcytosine-specific restriction endonuclease McrA
MEVAMRLLKPVEASVRFVSALYPRRQVVDVYVEPGTKRAVGWRFESEWWEALVSASETGAAFVGKCIDEPSGDERFYYRCKGRYYVTCVEMTLDEVPLVVDAERERSVRSLRNEIERIKAKAEFEGSVRAPIPKKVQILVWNRDGGRCVECGSTQNLEFDHIVPVSKGGGNSARNVQLLCEQCNRSKGGRIGG